MEELVTEVDSPLLTVRAEDMLNPVHNAQPSSVNDDVNSFLNSDAVHHISGDGDQHVVPENAENNSIRDMSSGNDTPAADSSMSQTSANIEVSSSVENMPLSTPDSTQTGSRMMHRVDTTTDESNQHIPSASESSLETNVVPEQPSVDESFEGRMHGQSNEGSGNLLTSQSSAGEEIQHILSTAPQGNDEDQQNEKQHGAEYGNNDQRTAEGKGTAYFDILNEACKEIVEDSVVPQIDSGVSDKSNENVQPGIERREEAAMNINNEVHNVRISGHKPTEEDMVSETVDEQATTSSEARKEQVPLVKRQGRSLAKNQDDQGDVTLQLTCVSIEVDTPYKDMLGVQPAGKEIMPSRRPFRGAGSLAVKRPGQDIVVGTVTQKQLAVGKAGAGSLSNMIKHDTNNGAGQAAQSRLSTGNKSSGSQDATAADGEDSSWEELVAKEISLHSASVPQNTSLQDKFAAASATAGPSGHRRPVRQARSLLSCYSAGEKLVSDGPVIRKKAAEEKMSEEGDTVSGSVDESRRTSGRKRKASMPADDEHDIEEVNESGGRLDEQDKEQESSSTSDNKKGKEASVPKPQNTFSKTAGLLRRNMESMKKLPPPRKTFEAKKTSLTSIKEKLAARRKLPMRAGSAKGYFEKCKKDLGQGKHDVKGEDQSSAVAGDKGSGSGAKLMLDHSNVKKPMFSSLERGGVKFNMKEMKFTLARAREAIRPPLDGKWKLDPDQKSEKSSYLKKMAELRELERKLRAKESSSELREQRLQKLGDEVDEKRALLKAQEAKYSQLVSSKEKRMQTLEIKLHRQEHQLAVKEKKLEAHEKQLRERQAKSGIAVGSLSSAPAVRRTSDSHPGPWGDGDDDMVFNDHDDSAGQAQTNGLNVSNNEQNTSDFIMGDQLSECMDWAERLTMIEKRLRQKDAKLHNLEETLQEMKMGLDRHHRELTLTSHVLSTKEKVLKLAEHQLSVSADELGGHYRALNQRERLIDLPVTTAPLINAGPPVLLGANDSLIMDEIEAMHHVSGRHMTGAHSGQSNREGDDDERANGFRSRDQDYSKAASYSDAERRDGDDVPPSQGCDEETWLRIVGSSSKTVSTPPQREGSAARSDSAPVAADDSILVSDEADNSLAAVDSAETREETA